MSELLNGKLSRSSRSEDEQTEMKNFRHESFLSIDRAGLIGVKRHRNLAIFLLFANETRPSTVSVMKPSKNRAKGRKGGLFAITNTETSASKHSNAPTNSARPRT